MPLGLYISVPFCRTKCSYCNFASGVFSRAVFQRYLDRVCADLRDANHIAERMGGCSGPAVDSIYLGGGTPTVLDSADLERLFRTIAQEFEVRPDCEVTVECAPGTLTPAILQVFQRCGVNRVSLGVQSFVDAEAASVGRLHKRATVLDDIARLRGSGITNINLDLIAGLPHQTPASWEASLSEVIASAAPHASVYMLEVDDDSRLGRELIAGGTRYHAHFVPGEELIADLYEMACQRLDAAGVCQYEISNFAQTGRQSRHNLKYWTRQPYLGFGVDAHSMLPAVDPHLDAVRFSSPDTLEQYAAAGALLRTAVSPGEALEETFFLGLRLTQGVDLEQVRTKFGSAAFAGFDSMILELTGLGLMAWDNHRLRLTPRGRLLSNEVFARFISLGSEV